jgi:hypothetical protein
MGEVVEFNGETTADLDPNKVLEAAIEANLQEAIVIGTTQDGELYLSLSISYVPDIIWLLMSAQKMLMDE